ncbi:hypothetical protein J7L13_03825, partial [bacterium]|nr:hypothetical protein [bacterium]
SDWIRHTLLATHYRKPLDFSEERLKQSAKIIARLREAKKSAPKTQPDKPILSEIFKAIEDDFNFPLALALWDENRSKLSQRSFKILEEIFGFSLKEEKVPEKVWRLAKEREEARKKKDFDLADKLRKEIEKAGYFIEDTPSGFRLKRKEEV